MRVRGTFSQTVELCAENASFRGEMTFGAWVSTAREQSKESSALSLTAWKLCK